MVDAHAHEAAQAEHDGQGEKCFPLPEEIYTKMFAALSGRKIYNSVFDYEFTSYDFAVAEEGLEGSVEKVYDYGEETFAKVNSGEFSIYVKIDKPVSDKITLAPDFSKVSVIEKERGIRIV